MPPKKAKKGGDGDGEGGGGGAASAMLVLQNRLEDTQNKLNAELIVIDQLRSINALQAKQLAEAEAVLKSETEKHAAELWLLYDEANAQKEEAEHKVEVLEERVKQLEGETHGQRTLEEENGKLRERVGDLMAQAEKESRAHADETHRLKKEVFSLRMQLEQTFRKSIQELDSEYRERAYASLDDESKNALAANAKLQAELHMQSEGIETLMGRYRTMEEAYNKLKIEYDVMAAEQKLQESRIGGLKRAHMVSASQLDELQGGALEATRKRVKELQAQLEREQKAREEAEHDAKNWEGRARFLEQKIADDAKLRKQRQRERDRAARELASRSRVTSSGVSAGGSVGDARGPESAGHGSATGDLRAASAGSAAGVVAAENSVEAFDAYADILSIWNSNFPSKRLAAKARREGGGASRAIRRAQAHARATAAGLPSPAMASTSRSQVGLEPLASTPVSAATAALASSQRRRPKPTTTKGDLSPLPPSRGASSYGGGSDA